MEGPTRTNSKANEVSSFFFFYVLGSFILIHVCYCFELFSLSLLSIIIPSIFACRVERAGWIRIWEIAIGCSRDRIE